MAGPIIILKPSGNIFDWSLQDSTLGPSPVQATQDSNQNGTRLNSMAFHAGMKLYGSIGGSWYPASSVRATFNGVELLIVAIGPGVSLGWYLGGLPLTAVAPTPLNGWNGALTKVDPSSMSIVPLGTVIQQGVDAIRVEA